VRRDVDEGITKLAAPRAGSFTRDEVADLGGDRQLVARRIAGGVWVDHGNRVLSLRGHPDEPRQRRWITLLAAAPSPCHLSHEAGAELHRLTAVLRGLLVATVTDGRHVEREGATYHQLVDVAPHHLTEVDGFPTTTPARTIVDLAAVLRTRRLGDALDDALVRRLATFSEIAQVLTDVRRRGKPGVRVLVDVLAERDGRPPAASHLEHLLHEAARLAGVRAVAQAPLPTRGVLTGLVDLAVVESRLILEADGRRWHAREQAMARDRQRDREAARQGWLTLRFVHADLAHDLAGCADDIRTTHRSRLPRRSAT
jgi:very-short-patch-repair endonuclease